MPTREPGLDVENADELAKDVERSLHPWSGLVHILMRASGDSWESCLSSLEKAYEEAKAKDKKTGTP